MPSLLHKLGKTGTQAALRMLAFYKKDATGGILGVEHACMLFFTFEKRKHGEKFNNQNRKQLQIANVHVSQSAVICGDNSMLEPHIFLRIGLDNACNDKPLLGQGSASIMTRDPLELVVSPISTTRRVVQKIV